MTPSGATLAALAVSCLLVACGDGSIGEGTEDADSATSTGTTSGEGGFAANGSGGTSAGGVSAGGAAEGGSGEGASGVGASGVGGSGEGGGAAQGGASQGEAAIGCSGHSAALLCDDFESGTIDASLWSEVTANGGSIAVDSSVVREGNHALRVTLPSQGGARGFLRADASVFPLPQNSMFGRAWIYAAGDVPNTHSKLLMLRGTLNGENAQYRLDSNSRDLNSRYSTPFINDNIQHGGLRKFGYELPANRWVCIEWHYDGANHEMRYWFDDNAINDMTVTGNEDPQWTAPPFDRFEIGWQTYQAGSQQSYDIYYDGIVLSDARIGCGVSSQP